VALTLGGIIDLQPLCRAVDRRTELVIVGIDAGTGVMFC
jgi:hypothetical protein